MKKMWKQNRVLFVLVIILAICFIAICAVALTFFYSKDVDSYGNRLEDKEKYKITEKFRNSYEEAFLENEHTKTVSFEEKGKIIYIHLGFDEEIDIEAAKKIATKSLELFKEDIISYYDIQFILKSDNFTIIGAKNSIIDFISWNNNLEIEEEEETDEAS